MDVDLDNKEVRWKIEESNEKKTLLNLTTGSGGTGYDLDAAPEIMTWGGSAGAGTASNKICIECSRADKGATNEKEKSSVL